ncbi:MAG: ABC-F family ATP-binding cassette domain-containing protein [Ruminococcaceae bacterium]|nr:ABC-F family ATP-binding cassette domain-containing protein [Oscillospiraceae bacterium]
MIAINTENLSLSFGTKAVLKGVSFAADEADHVGVIGTNGCGKSTLFKLILGELEPDEGSVHISKDKTVGILRQDDAFLDFEGQDGEASALEVMYNSFPELLLAEKRLAELERMLSDGGEHEGRSNASLVAEYTALNEKFIRDGGLEFRGRCASTLAKMGFDADAVSRPFSSLSGGQRTRLALSRELCREPDILMLDEPTNHLDMETLTWLESFLAAYKKCVLVISHDRYFLDRVTNKTLLIEHNKAKLYNGNYTKSAEQRKVDREIQERHYKNQQKEIERQEAYIAQQRAWNRERNIIAAESRLKLLDKMERVERPEDAPRGISFSFSCSIASGNDVMMLRDVSFAYPSSPMLIRALTMTVKRGDRLFIVGPNGCGKSTLIKMLMSRLMPSSGYIDMGYNVNVGYYDQENQNLTPSNTVLEELWSSYRTRTELEMRSTLARFRFFGDDVYKLVGELSGGERARLTLSKLVLSDINLLILDEPTNHLDIGSREALEAAIAEFDGTVIAVSHDRYFLGKLATRILDLTGCPESEPTDMNVHKSGDGYEELLRDRARRAEQSGAATPERETDAAPSNKDIYLMNKKQASDERRAKRRLEKLSAEAESIENELEEIEKEMSGEAAYDYVRLSELDTKKNALEERLLEIYEEIGV